MAVTGWNTTSSSRALVFAAARGGVHLAAAISPIVGRKLSTSLKGRLEATAGWLSWGAARRDHPLIWVHAASVGEALTAVPVIRRLRAARSECRIMLTYTSPAAHSWPSFSGVERRDYLPPTDRWTMDALFESLEPAVLVFARGDLWAGLVAGAARYGVPVVLIGGAVRPDSTRLSPVVRGALRRSYRALRWAGAVSSRDAERLRRLGARESAIHVAGDPRHDQILEQDVSLQPAKDILRWAGSDPVLVAGSTEPEDDEVLPAAFQVVASRRPDARLVIVPHEPDPRRTGHMLERARALGLSAAVHGPDVQQGARLLILTAVGTLSDLYLAGAFAYVGGGFRRSGLHNVAEPAAWGVPVMFGDAAGALPADACRLLAAGGGVTVPKDGAARVLATRWTTWLEEPALARRSGLAARSTLESGAADISARAILEHL
jgi:3-deoxy-D-manno-octulosonic-acid transferase